MRAFLLFFRDVWVRSFSMNVYLTPPLQSVLVSSAEAVHSATVHRGFTLIAALACGLARKNFHQLSSLLLNRFLHLPEIIFNDTMFVFIFSILIFLLPAFAPNKMFFYKRKKLLYDENYKKYISWRDDKTIRTLYSLDNSYERNIWWNFLVPWTQMSQCWVHSGEGDAAAGWGAAEITYPRLLRNGNVFKFFLTISRPLGWVAMNYFQCLWKTNTIVF